MKIKNIAIFGVFSFAAWKLLKKATDIQELIIAQLEAEIERLKAVLIPVKFKINSISGGKINVTVRLFDLDGKNFKDITYDAAGNNVAVDFLVCEIGKRYIAFPYRVFTDAVTPANGLNLLNAINIDNFPKVMFSTTNTEEFTKQIKALWAKIVKNDIESLNIFGNMLQPPTPKAGDIYRCEVHTKGGLELIREFTNSLIPLNSNNAPADRIEMFNQNNLLQR